MLHIRHLRINIHLFKISPPSPISNPLSISLLAVVLVLKTTVTVLKRRDGTLRFLVPILVVLVLAESLIGEVDV